jgi:enoyl-CoA hydratase
VTGYEFIRTRVEDGVGIITLDRPETINGWHAPMRREVIDALKAFNEDHSVKAVLVTGAGEKAWSSGQYLNETQKIQGGEEGAAWADEWREFYNTLRFMDKGTVAALNGVAAGSAYQFAMLHDVVVGHPGSRMGQPEINSGISSVGGPHIMDERIGHSRTAELTLRGRMMSGTEAYEAGVIHFLVERQYQVMPKAMEIARLLASKAPLAMKLTKQRLREMTQPGLDEMFEANHAISAENYASGEPQKWMAKFFEERAARKAAKAAAEKG